MCINSVATSVNILQLLTEGKVNSVSPNNIHHYFKGIKVYYIVYALFGYFKYNLSSHRPLKPSKVNY